MAHAQGNSKNNKANVSINAGGDTEVKPTTFHDFLGNKGQGQESAPAAVDGSRPPPEVSPSSTSDLGSERNAGNHLEGIPFYGSRGDITGPESSNRFTGNKRSNSDSFMISSRDKFPQGLADSQDSPLLTKLLRYSGGERPRQPRDDETSFGVHQMRPISASFISQSPTGGRTDTNPSKWDRGTAVNPALYHNILHVVVRSCHMAIKGPQIGRMWALLSYHRLRLMKDPELGCSRSGKQKSGFSISEPESSSAPSQRGTESSGRQMTIFYGGQAHVFDNVHPNKADVIMALAGSNGGSWSTTYTPNSTARPSGGDNDAATMAILRELHGRPSDKGESH
ncbi:hypothetical protein DH2020_046772 [Rehmannia glutinosa]|uniref:Protein TIFY n=1 Tax=Rehmannia glutinosa TaxID=99300 RepID=A0ABR0UBX8_REHGL